MTAAATDLSSCRFDRRRSVIVQNRLTRRDQKQRDGFGISKEEAKEMSKDGGGNEPDYKSLILT